jgi:recombinational DNA repair protein RecR
MSIITNFMSQILHFLKLKNNDYEYCPNCGMVLEDSEECSFCDWKSRKG